MRLFITKKETLPNELGEMLDYVLENSLDINEYFDGEKIRIIYNDNENEFEKGYIFKSKDKRKKLQLK